MAERVESDRRMAVLVASMTVGALVGFGITQEAEVGPAAGTALGALVGLAIGRIGHASASGAGMRRTRRA